jgi:hypothetical protein
MKHKVPQRSLALQDQVSENIKSSEEQNTEKHFEEQEQLEEAIRQSLMPEFHGAVYIVRYYLPLSLINKLDINGCGLLYRPRAYLAPQLLLQTNQKFL